jgi:hypothetical protein
MKPTRAQVLQLATLHRLMKEAEEMYNEQAQRFRLAGPGVYLAGDEKVIVSKQQRAKVDWARLRKKYKIPEKEIERATSYTPFTRIDVEYPK